MISRKIAAVITTAALLATSTALLPGAAVTANADEAAPELSAATAPEESGETLNSGGFTFDTYDGWNGTYATVTGFNEPFYAARVNKNFSNDHTVTIPTEVLDNSGKKYPVTRINIYNNYTGGKESCTFKTLNIPKTVTEIGSSFQGMSNIEYIVLENGAQLKYGSYDIDLSGCTSLKRIGIGNSGKLPNTSKSIDYNAFENCSSLQSITIPDGVTIINSSAFQGCTSLKRVSLPDSLTNVDSEAFRDCTSLTELTFPAAIKEISSGAFRGCTSLKKVTFTPYKAGKKAGKCELRTIGGSTWWGGGAFEDCTSLNEVNFVPAAPDYGDGCSINDCAFKNTGLTGINIPEGFISIGEEAFAGTHLDKNGLKTDKGQSYGIAFFHKTATIDDNTFGDVKPTIAGYDNANADVFAFDHQLNFVSLGNWNPYIVSFGDLDDDGVSDSSDAVMVLRACASLISLTEDQANNADLDEDGEVTANDAVLILRTSIGLDG